MKTLSTLALLLVSLNCFAVGKIQNEDVKTVAQLIAAGSNSSHLINDTKIYSTVFAEQLSTALGDGSIMVAPFNDTKIIMTGVFGGESLHTAATNGDLSSNTTTRTGGTSVSNVFHVEYGTWPQCTVNGVCPAGGTGTFSGGILNLTRTGTGLYTLNIRSATFADVPACTITAMDGGQRLCIGNSSQSVTTWPISCVVASTAVAVDAAISVICMASH